MEFLKPNWHWKGYLEPIDFNVINGIALHHMAHKTADHWEVEKWHHENGWIGIGYNYWIDKLGNILEARGLHLAAGVKDNNYHLISIGFQGDYNEEKCMSTNQIIAGQKLISWLKTQLPNISTIAGHNNWNDTSCPGVYFPLSNFQNGLQLLRKGSNGTEVRELQKMLNKIGYELNVDGDFGNNTESAVKHFQESLQLTVDGIVGSITYNAIVNMSNKLRSCNMDIDKAIEILFNEKIITDKNYWKLAINYQVNVEQLLKNMAERLL